MNKQLQFLMYTTPQEDVKIDVVVKDETIWLTQKAMAMLFDVQVPAISKHLKNIFQEGELLENATVSKMEIVVNRGFRGEIMEMIEFYNLDAIISVGYRVNSAKAETEYAEFNKHQQIVSDFDKEIKKLEQKADSEPK
ncbi:hypothetical protein AGMMS49982_04180 [Bacteroidia bacterium]|nr:hypothetical protein AGMMS49982_04180 [Bacteroidia bacterium]